MRPPLNNNTIHVVAEEDTTSLTVDWPELHRDSQAQQASENPNRRESIQVHRESTKARRQSTQARPESTQVRRTSRRPRVGIVLLIRQDTMMMHRGTMLKTGVVNGMGPRRDTLRVDTSTRKQNNSTKKPVLNQDSWDAPNARGLSYLAPSIIVEECPTPEGNIMRHRDSTFHHAERMLMSSGTSPQLPTSREQWVDHLDVDDGSDLSKALSDTRCSKVRHYINNYPLITIIIYGCHK